MGKSYSCRRFGNDQKEGKSHSPRTKICEKLVPECREEELSCKGQGSAGHPQHPPTKSGGGGQIPLSVLFSEGRT